MRPHALLPAFAFTVACTALAACVRIAPAPGVPAGDTATLVIGVDGFSGPESVRYDADQDVHFVGNWNGPASAADDNGFISRMRPDGSIEALRFIAGGTKGVTLHAWTPGTASSRVLGESATGRRYDGVELRADGSILVASQADSSIHLFRASQGQPLVRVQGAPADIAYDTKRHRVAVPYVARNRVEIFQLH